jgi:hypothetical protein
MNEHHKEIGADGTSCDSYDNIQASERQLNAAIVSADVTNFEHCLEVLDSFYAEDIEVSGEMTRDPIRGKTRARSLLYSFLFTLHAMVEVGALSLSIRETAIPGDSDSTTHSAWTLELAASSGATCILKWSTLRKWDRFRVVREHHYDYQQIGGPLTLNDFGFNVSSSISHSYSN